MPLPLNTTTTNKSPLTPTQCPALLSNHQIHSIHTPKHAHSKAYTPYTPHQSHLPSFHPVLHLSSHLAQSNTSFPSFLFTSLCASHSHVPSSSRLPARTGLFPGAMYRVKCSPHVQHGYSRANRRMKLRTSDCSAGVGWVGYVAAIECRSVQPERPRVSTSGGQSFGMVTAGFGAAVVVVDFLVCEAQAAKEVQLRQLGGGGKVSRGLL